MKDHKTQRFINIHCCYTVHLPIATKKKAISSQDCKISVNDKVGNYLLNF